MYKTTHGIAWLGWIIGGCILLQAEVPGGDAADRRIESLFAESQVYRTHLGSDRIEVTSVAGVVRLTGQVSTPCGKALAQELLLALPGVRGIDNRVEVALEAGEGDEAWVRSKVCGLLAIHRRAWGPDAEVDFRDGVITLSGTVASEDQIALALAHAADVHGVDRVIHEMRVGGPPTGAIEARLGEVDDASVTAQIRVALKMHHSTSGLNPQVRTRQGVVMVTGMARSMGEIERVSRVASDIRGVKGLLNRMTLEGSAVRPSPVTGLRVVIGSK